MSKKSWNGKTDLYPPPPPTPILLYSFPFNYLVQVMLALMYAAEAYHSRGAMRFVGAWTQMEDQNISEMVSSHWIIRVPCSRTGAIQ